MTSNTYKSRGGARLSWGGLRAINFSWPFASIEVDRDLLVLRIFAGGVYALEPREITSLQPYKGLFSRGIKIEHKREHWPSTIIFWTFRLPEVRSALLAHGYAVQPEPAPRHG